MSSLTKEQIERLDARSFRKSQVYYVLYSSNAEEYVRQLAIRYVNDVGAGTTPWWIYQQSNQKKDNNAS